MAEGNQAPQAPLAHFPSSPLDTVSTPEGLTTNLHVAYCVGAFPAGAAAFSTAFLTSSS
jgi:hypothetical protein